MIGIWLRLLLTAALWIGLSAGASAWDEVGTSIAKYFPGWSEVGASIAKYFPGWSEVGASIAKYTAPSCCSPEGREFVGPFANWLNVQTTCGATGNGTTNDATAIQTCIGDLTATHPVLYFPPPSVCYNITSELTIAAHSYDTLIGASPTTTPICWGGTSGGTMLYVNGMAYGMVGRLTFNGKTTASILINQSWDGSTGTFDTQNQYPDVVLENGRTGISMRRAGAGLRRNRDAAEYVFYVNDRWRGNGQSKCPEYVRLVLELRQRLRRGAKYAWRRRVPRLRE